MMTIDNNPLAILAITLREPQPVGPLLTRVTAALRDRRQWRPSAGTLS